MRICLGGDVMLGRGVDESLLARGLSPFEAVAPLWRDADLVAVNLECAITGQDVWYQGPPKAFYFRARPFAAQALADAGVRLVTLANNHALDAGETGLLDTLRLLDAVGIAHAGAGRDAADAALPAVRLVRGRRVGCLAYCDHQPDFAAGDRRPGIRYLDLADPPRARALLADDLGAARAACDHVLVAFHWQPNWAPTVEPLYRELGRHCLEQGASLVWGHSPHHFQGVEFVGKKAIVYSAGDLVDDYAIHPDFRNDRQVLFTVSLGEDGVTSLEARPLEIRLGMPRPARPEVAAWIRAALVRACQPLGSRVRGDGDVWVVESQAAALLRDGAGETDVADRGRSIG